MQYVGLSLA